MSKTVSLKSLCESKVPGFSKATTFRIDPNLVQFEEGFNLRTDDEELHSHIERMYLAMLEGAFFPPIDVSIVNEKVVCREGHCRTRAARRVKEKMPDFTLECRQLWGNEADAVLHMLGTGSGGKPLTPLEQGLGYLRLIRFGLTLPDIARKLGVTRVTVDNGLKLAEAPVEVQQMIRQGEVSATTAREAINNGAEGVEALKAAVVEERANPAPVKNGKKKKKVTPKKLKGTAAEKKSAPALAEDEVSISIVKKDSAKAALDVLKVFLDEQPELKPFIVALETALL